MPSTVPPARAVLQHVPAPPVVRAMLANAVREAELLRRLLRVAERLADGAPAGRRGAPGRTRRGRFLCSWRGARR
jgi:hypothetical protein